jgi:hypothetical protein
VTPMMSEDFVREWFSDLVEAQSSLRTLTAICGEQQVARLEDAADRLPAAFGIVRPRRAPVLLALDGEPQFALHADPVLPVRHPDRERRLVRSGGNGERGDRGEGPAGTSSGQPHVSVTSVHSPLAFMVSDTKAGASNGAASPKTANPGRGTSSPASRLACSRSRLVNSGYSSSGTTRIRQAPLPATPAAIRDQPLASGLG